MPWLVSLVLAFTSALSNISMSSSFSSTGSRSGESIERHIYVTAFTWHDNTPPGSAEISHPRVHSHAGGAGTYDDPVTVAVGHSIVNGQDILDVPAGTRMYLPTVRRYAIVEDTCGDGPRPQDGPCHRLDTPGNPAPAGATRWIDIWIDGRDLSAEAADACASDLTDLHTVVMSPRRGYLVQPGPIADSTGCHAGFGEVAQLDPGTVRRSTATLSFPR